MAYGRGFRRGSRGFRGGRRGRKLRGMSSGVTWGYAHPRAGVSKKRSRSQSDIAGVSSVYSRARRGAEYSKKKYKTARRGARSKGKSVDRKLLAANVERIVYYFKGMDSDFDGAFGYYPLSRVVNPDTWVDLPFYLYNVTAATNDGIQPVPFYRLRLNGTGNQIALLSEPGQNSTGAVTFTTSLRDSPASTTNGVGSRSYLDWLRVRMNLYGQRTRTTEVNVKLVTLDQKVFETSNAGSNVYIPETEPAQAFWKKLFRPYMSNPIAGGSSVNQFYMKTIASKKYMIDPTTTIENDPDSNIKTIDWFHRIGKVINYQRKGNDVTAAQMQQGDLTTVNANSDGFNCTPINAKQAVWLMVYASNYNPVTKATWDGYTAAQKSDYAASFDLNIETCHKVLDAW